MFSVQLLLDNLSDDGLGCIFGGFGLFLVYYSNLLAGFRNRDDFRATFVAWFEGLMLRRLLVDVVELTLQIGREGDFWILALLCVGEPIVGYNVVFGSESKEDLLITPGQVVVDVDEDGRGQLLQKLCDQVLASTAVHHPCGNIRTLVESVGMSLDIFPLIIPEDRLDVLSAKYPIHQIIVLAVRVFFNRKVDVHILDLSSSCDQGDPNGLDDTGVPLI